MSTVTPITGILARALENTDKGVIGLVDNLLQTCGQQTLHLDWHGEQCRIVTDGILTSSMPIRKSIFRAILARLAVLCNQRRPDSVSPYGGEGELAVGSPETVFQVSFVNTPDEQKVELKPLLPRADWPV